MGSNYIKGTKNSGVSGSAKLNSGGMLVTALIIFITTVDAGMIIFAKLISQALIGIALIVGGLEFLIFHYVKLLKGSDLESVERHYDVRILLDQLSRTDAYFLHNGVHYGTVIQNNGRRFRGRIIVNEHQGRLHIDEEMRQTLLDVRDGI